MVTEADPAVTTPSFLNTGGSLARESLVVLGRGCSSQSTTTSFLFSVTVTGQSSSLKYPLSLAKKICKNNYKMLKNVIKLEPY